MEIHTNASDMTLSYALHVVEGVRWIGEDAELCFDCPRRYGNACIKVEVIL